ncbi:MAG TPA: DNA polymerase III subunit delta [Acidimicrobiales bacterium]|nr:DNA polymerase III subunit delta [Acidimicrobiales bacterium]
MTAQATADARGGGGNRPGAPPPAYLVRGDDPSLVAQAMTDLLSDLLDDRDPDSTVEEHGAAGEDIDLDRVVDALTTPPFLVDRRVVVVREAGRLSAADAARLVGLLVEPVEGVVLVLGSGGGSLPSALDKAVQRAGAVVNATAGTGRARSQWLSEQLRGAPVRLDARAAALLAEHLGQDLGRLRGLLDSLAAAYGDGASVDEDRLAPFLGEAGSVASWDLTDAIDTGDAAAALEALHRLLGAGGVHPLAVMGVLHRHVQAMLRLDGSPVTTAEEAAALIGSRSAYPARKALEQGRRLGAARIGRAVTLLADADLDLRGRSALDDEIVLEVLVGRLARLSASAEAGARKRSGRPAMSRRH